MSRRRLRRGHFLGVPLELGWDAVGVDVSGGRFVYVGNHPCFVGPTQEHVETGVPRLHPDYRRAGWWKAAEAPGTTPGGWRQRLGSFVHLPLADFLSCFAGFTLEAVEELEDGYEYPKTIALRLRKP